MVRQFACVFILLSLPFLAFGIRSLAGPDLLFYEAPDYRNGDSCPPSPAHAVSICDSRLVHVAMTLDSEYLRGTIAAVHSVLKHASCPESTFFHFIASADDARSLTRVVRSVFPSLHFRIHVFRQSAAVGALISASIRPALENPLNYARSYLADIIDACVTRVIYLDSDLVVVDDIAKLWSTVLRGGRVIGAPEYCHANFTRYFTPDFWADPDLPRVFANRSSSPCYFNTGVMVMDLGRWRKGGYTERIEGWMEVQKGKRIYELGSLPAFLLVFGGEVEAIEHRWNQHGLGGDNVRGSCRGLHPGPVSLLHWSGKGKPWVRLDEGRACPLDHLWEPYDLKKGGGGGGTVGGGGAGALVGWL